MRIESSGGDRKNAENLAIASSCFGFSGEAMLTDSAVIILFAGMLGAGDILSLVTTSILPLLNGLGIIPMAFLAASWGKRRLITVACLLALCAYFGIVTAPFFTDSAIGILFGMLLLFSASSTGFVAAWFPLLDTFLTPDRRIPFFGRMRFLHQLSAVAFLFLVSLLIGSNPGVETLQCVLFAGAVLFAGRLFFIRRIPVFPEPDSDAPNPFNGLLTAIRNKRLRNFSIFQFLLNCAVFGTAPLSVLYLKNVLGATDNIIVMISAVGFTGMLLGYLAVRPLVAAAGVRGAFRLLLGLFFAVNAGLVFLHEGSIFTIFCMAIFLAVSGFSIAAFSILASSEMLALATPGNKTMAMAFCGAFYYGGAGVSRGAASLLLGMLPLEFLTLNPFQSLYLFYAAIIALSGIFIVRSR